MRFLKEFFQIVPIVPSEKNLRKSVAPFASSLAASTREEAGKLTPQQLAEALNWLSLH